MPLPNPPSLVFAGTVEDEIPWNAHGDQGQRGNPGPPASPPPPEHPAPPDGYRGGPRHRGSESSSDFEAVHREAPPREPGRFVPGGFADRRCIPSPEPIDRQGMPQMKSLSLPD